MSKIVRPAALVKQGSLTLYSTSMKVADLLLPNFYSVEKLDPDNPNDKGYQRLLNKARAKKLADYILDGLPSHDAFLPTSIFLATDKSVIYYPSNNTIEIDLREVAPFSVVDGQHRIEGLKLAAEKDESVKLFEIPVNIAVNLPKIHQMCHFLIVNTTQKSVDKGVEQQITARLTRELEVGDFPSLPKWIMKSVKKGEDEQALDYVTYLNTQSNSPWYGRIKMANQDINDGTVNQKSFVRSIKKFLLVANNPINAYEEGKRHRIFLNYWVAIATILGTEESLIVYKYNGIELFCRFAVPFFNRLVDSKDFTVETMVMILNRTFENMEGEYAGVGHPEFWMKGNKASFLNSGAMNNICSDMVRNLHKANSSEVQL